MPSPFENDIAARALLERLRWPHGPQCPRCDAQEPEVFLIGGEKHNHRPGLYHCKRCRRGFSVTVGTSFERLRIPLSTWVSAARAFSSDGKPTLLKIQSDIGVAYRTVLRMRDVIERAARSYRGHKYVFGAWPQELMHHERESREKTIQATVLKKALPALKSGEANRTERLLRLLLAAPKVMPRKKRRRPLV
ncbi:MULTISPECIES: transposase [Bradyrhizobium]|uniref:transposase n=1 Tax=Bradyrhizobium TaxID=374 RepID=UPI00048014D2|nr:MULTISPECIES: transposase [Bradyrhizobium]MBR0884769.1 transposase [Bradyrhizobium liaoningense]MBR1004789.1 transposase [Bradyrhizobium liaoningense]MBR1071034.1 transposase [Bradyrhizobium liaoningense]WLB95854.1 transposase [Bradyrhizobium japonicum USDA 123]